EDLELLLAAAALAALEPHRPHVRDEPRVAAPYRRGAALLLALRAADRLPGQDPARGRERRILRRTRPPRRLRRGARGDLPLRHPPPPGGAPRPCGGLPPDGGADAGHLPALHAARPPHARLGKLGDAW